MIPSNGDDLQQGFTVVRQPDYTFALDFEAGRATGFVDGIEAVKQAVYLALSIERFKHEIYTPRYGNELSTLFGTSPPLVYAQIKQAITEALSVDNRILGVSEFAFERDHRKIKVSFTVNSVYGGVPEELEVTV